MSSEDYFFPLPNIKFDQAYLQEFVRNEIAPEDWYVFDCGKLRWTVQESYDTIRSECTSFKRTEWFQELYQLFKEPINFGDVLFTRTPPPGVPPHIDRNRPVAINFPVIGAFKDSPILFYDNFDRGSEVSRFYHSDMNPQTGENLAVMFNPQKIHGVINEDDRSRCLLSIWWRDISYADLKTRWLDGSLIDWEQNEKNKYIKVSKV